MDKNLNLIGCVESTNKSGSIIKYSVYYGFIEEHLQDEFVDSIKNYEYDYLEHVKKNYEDGLIGFYIINVFQKKDSIKIPTFVLSGKNLGKKNATTIETQTIKEATSIYDKYKRNNNKSSDMYPPMLASKFNEKSGLENVTFDELVLDKNYFVEYKFDGNRAVSYFSSKKNAVTMYSRERKIIYPHKFLAKELEHLYQMCSIVENIKDFYFDGELYLHGVPLQTITGQVRKQKPEDVTMFYKFYVFDMFNPKNPNMQYRERRALLNTVLEKTLDFEYIIPVASVLTNDTSIVQKMYVEALSNQYEGLMLKDPDAPYEYSYKNYHSKFLKKIKPSTRREYEIVGFETGKGKNIKAVTLVLKTDEGKLFNCTIKNTLDYKEELYELWQNEEYFKNNVLGKLATVEFQSTSNDDIPLRGVVIEIHL